MLFKNQATARRNRLPHIFWVFFYGWNQSYLAIYFYNSHEFRIISFVVMKCSRENMNKYLPSTLNRNAVVQRKYRKFRSPQLKHHTHPPSPCTRDWGLPTHWAGRGFIQSPNKFIRRVSFSEISLLLLSWVPDQWQSTVGVHILIQGDWTLNGMCIYWIIILIYSFVMGNQI